MHENCQAGCPAMSTCLMGECPSPDHCMICTECEEKEYQCQCPRPTPGEEEFEDIPF